MFTLAAWRPSPALAVAVLALFLALGGGGYAAQAVSFLLGVKNTTVATTGLYGKVKGSVLVIKNTKLNGGPPLALIAPPGKAPFAVNSATKVIGLNADYLDDLDAAAFVRTTISPWHYVGAAGEPTFFSTWVNYDANPDPVAAPYQHAAYRIDNNHVVHLQGMVKGGAITTGIFTLPDAARPHFSAFFSVASHGAFGEVLVQTNGLVVAQVGDPTNWISLNGISYPDATSDAAGIAAAPARH